MVVTSSLAFLVKSPIIGIGDLTRKANELVTTTYRPLEIYTFLILEYLVLILVVSYFVRKLENKLEYK